MYPSFGFDAFEVKIIGQAILSIVKFSVDPAIGHNQFAQSITPTTAVPCLSLYWNANLGVWDTSARVGWI
jgi:hypothetical protein